MTIAETRRTIDLSIGRTKISSTKCAFPNCANELGLKRIEKKNRFNILKDNRVFISSEARICPSHIHLNAWSEINHSSQGLLHDYTRQQIEEMIDVLITFEGSKQLEKAGNF